MRSLLALPVLLALSPALLAQSGTADQSSPFGNAWFNGGSSGLTWQVEVACGTAGNLEGFELYLQGAAGATLDLDVKVGSGWNVSAPVWSGTLTTAGTGGWEHFFVDTSASNIALSVGSLFVIEMAGITGVGIQGQYNAPPATPPYPEELYLNGPGCFADCGWRIGFVTWMEQAGPTLSKTGTCPGPVSLTVTDATPRGPVALLYGFPGSYTRGGGSCAGLTIGISQPTLAGIFNANVNGIASISFNSPPGLCGRSVIGIDLRSCTATNIITL
jgi:hypothetical protein